MAISSISRGAISHVKVGFHRCIDRIIANKVAI